MNGAFSDKSDISDRPAISRVTARTVVPCRTWGTPANADPERELYLDFTLPEAAAGAPVFVHRDGVYVRIAGTRGRLRAPILSGELKYFYTDSGADPRDYYYLPAEDEAIHKSVAQFVDRTHRVRATKKTCYTRRTGLFLPAFSDADAPLFRTDYADPRRYTEYTNEKDVDSWLIHVLSSFLDF